MKGLNHLINLEKARVEKRFVGGGGSARKLVAAAARSSFRDRRCAPRLLKPGLDSKLFPPSDPSLQRGGCASREPERSSGRRRRSAVKWNARWCRLSSLFSIPLHPTLSCLHAPFHPFPLHIHASFGFLSFRGLHAPPLSLSLHPSFPLERCRRCLSCLPFLSFPCFPRAAFPVTLFFPRVFNAPL